MALLKIGWMTIITIVQANIKAIYRGSEGISTRIHNSLARDRGKESGPARLGSFGSRR